MPGRLHYGTSSWSEKSWVGVFYPDGMPPADWLSHYATVFRTVEADVTYYRVPDKKLVDGWAERTPEGFVLAAKFPRSVVHGGDEAQPDGARVLVPEAVGDDCKRFLDAMGRLGAKCGLLVLQFPYFNKKAFTSRQPFLERLDAFLGALPKSFRYAVDLLYMPHLQDLAKELDVVTTDFVYARLIGDRKAVEERTDRFDHVVVDQGPRLDRWAVLLRDLLEHVPEAYVYANNHYAGHGPATIKDLVARYEALAR